MMFTNKGDETLLERFLEHSSKRTALAKALADHDEANLELWQAYEATVPKTEMEQFRKDNKMDSTFKYAHEPKMFAYYRITFPDRMSLPNDTRDQLIELCLAIHEQVQQYLHFEIPYTIGVHPSKIAEWMFKEGDGEGNLAIEVRWYGNIDWFRVQDEVYKDMARYRYEGDEQDIEVEGMPNTYVRFWFPQMDSPSWPDDTELPSWGYYPFAAMDRDAYNGLGS